MIFLIDQIGRVQQAKYIVEMPVFQPATNEIFYEIVAIGYDDVRRTTLFRFNTESEMKEKYKEVYQDYMNQFRIQLKR